MFAKPNCWTSNDQAVKNVFSLKFCLDFIPYYQAQLLDEQLSGLLVDGSRIA